MRLVVAFALILSSACAALWAQQPPYDNPPDAQPPYYRVRYQASSGDGELLYPVAYTIWVPPQVASLRGVIVHQHGCGEGSCKSGQTGAFDLHWQALAKQHDCALLAPSYEQPDGADCQMWCDPRNGSATTFQTALTDLAELTGHPELATVPWALWGHSGGGHWAGGMLLLYPDRVAAVWLRSGVPLFAAVEGRAIAPHQMNHAATGVPVMCNLGSKEGVTDKEGRFAGVWPSNQAFFAKLRSAGALIAISIDPLTSHECGNQRYLAIPWFDACLSLRLPGTQGEPLRMVSAADGWLAPVQTGEAEIVPPVPAPMYDGDLASAIWLPSENVALAWTQYMRDTSVQDTTPPPAPTNVRLIGNQLTWDAEADLESGIAHFVIEHEGKIVAQVPDQPLKSFGRPLFQGLQYSDTPAVPLTRMEYQLASPAQAEPSLYRVRAVNTVGLMSP